MSSMDPALPSKEPPFPLVCAGELTVCDFTLRMFSKSNVGILARSRHATFRNAVLEAGAKPCGADDVSGTMDEYSWDGLPGGAYTHVPRVHGPPPLLRGLCPPAAECPH